MMAIGAVNYVAVVASAIVAMIFGFIWHSPTLFGNRWMKLAGVSEKEMKKNMAGSALGGFVTVLISAFVLAHFVSGVPLGGALFVGFLFWLGFMLPRAAGVVLWQGKSMELFLIEAGHDIIGMFLMSAVLVLIA